LVVIRGLPISNVREAEWRVEFPWKCSGRLWEIGQRFDQLTPRSPVVLGMPPRRFTCSALNAALGHGRGSWVR
jgi:hypothetical protein